jgi:hypothetical protein
VAHSRSLGDSFSNYFEFNSYRFRGFHTECLRIARYDQGLADLGVSEMVMKVEELVLVAALVVGLITTGWAVLAMAALQ